MLWVHGSKFYFELISVFFFSCIIVVGLQQPNVVIS